MDVRQIQQLVDGTSLLLPSIPARELELFRTCGRSTCGHAVLACLTCCVETEIAFTCKRRLCPRCTTRRREDRTPHLMNKVLQDLPYRHWNLCLPAELRYNLGRYPELLAAVLACFVASIFAQLRRNAMQQRSKLSWTLLAWNMLYPAALSFRHRVSADLTPNIHFHCLVPDGVFVELSRGGPVQFLPLDPLTEIDIAHVATDTCRRVRKLLMLRRYWKDARKPPDGDAVRGVVSLRGSRTVTLYGRAVGYYDDTPRRAGADAFDVFASSRVAKGDRAGLENLVRYLLAPPFTADQLSIDASGDVIFRPHRPRHNGTAERRFTPREFVRALAGLASQPRSHAIGYHGALARNARIRKQAIPHQRPRPSAALIAEANDMKTPDEAEAWRKLHVRAHRQDFFTCSVCCDRLLLVRLVGPDLRYENPRWVAPDIPSHPVAAPD